VGRLQKREGTYLSSFSALFNADVNLFHQAPFVLTPEFAHVMGGKGSPTFQKFCDLCCKAYNILRQHKNVFINLFAMVCFFAFLFMSEGPSLTKSKKMLSTGIPELTSEEDIDYLSTALSFDLTDEEVSLILFSSVCLLSLFVTLTVISSRLRRHSQD